MSDFIEWAGPKKFSGIYYDPKTKRYSTTLSDLDGITFKELEEAREWLLKQE